MAAFYREYLHAALGGRVSERPAADGRNRDARVRRVLRRLGPVARAVARACPLPARRGPRADGPAPIASVFTRHVSPQIAAALLGQPRTLLSERQAQTVDALKASVPGLHDDATADVELPDHPARGQGGDPSPLDDIARPPRTFHALQRFVRTLRRDLSAVEGAVRERWSNGPVEGHINRLKMLRRQMYGRAGVELLRARLLPMPCSSVR